MPCTSRTRCSSDSTIVRDVNGPTDVARWRGSWSVLYPMNSPDRPCGKGTPDSTRWKNARGDQAASASAMSPSIAPPANSVSAIARTESGSAPESVSL